MKICIIGTIKSVHTQRWCNYFADRNYEVHVVDFLYNKKKMRKKNSEIQNSFNKDIHIHADSWIKKPWILSRRIPSKIISSMIVLFIKHYYIRTHFRQIISEIEPDIVHAHILTNYGFLASQLHFHPFIASSWGTDISIVKRGSKDEKELKEVFLNADWVYTGDDTGKRRLIELGCDSKKVLINIWGVDTKRFNPSARSKKLRNEILGNKHKRIVTITSALKRRYNIETLIRAAPLVLAKRSKCKFMIIGEGPLRDELEELSIELGVIEKIIFKGRIPHEDIHSYIASSDIYINTFYTDKGGGGIGVATMEGMSSGLPIVAAKRPGIEIGVNEGMNGLLFKGGNPKALAKKIITLLENDDMRKELGRNSRKKALEIGDWENNMAEINLLYNQLNTNKSK